jgi:hypothetical protein
MKKIIRSEINLNDTWYGLVLNVRELMNDPVYPESMLVEAKDKEGNIKDSIILLTHQLTYEKLGNISRQGELEVFVKPIYPIKEIRIFEEKK